MTRLSRSDGQATLEAALTLPVVLVALLLIVQVGIVVRDALALAQAAREGARTAAISASDDEAADAIARSAGPLAADRIVIVLSPPAGQRERGDPVTARLSYEERLSIPIVSKFVSLKLPLRASATTQLERSDVTPSPTPSLSPSPSPSLSPSAGPTPSPSPSPSPSPG